MSTSRLSGHPAEQYGITGQRPGTQVEVGAPRFVPKDQFHPIPPEPGNIQISRSGFKKLSKASKAQMDNPGGPSNTYFHRTSQPLPAPPPSLPQRPEPVMQPPPDTQTYHPHGLPPRPAVVMQPPPDPQAYHQHQLPQRPNPVMQPPSQLPAYHQHELPQRPVPGAGFPTLPDNPTGSGSMPPPHNIPGLPPRPVTGGIGLIRGAGRGSSTRSAERSKSKPYSRSPNP